MTLKDKSLAKQMEQNKLESRENSNIFENNSDSDEFFGPPAENKEYILCDLFNKMNLKERIKKRSFPSKDINNFGWGNLNQKIF